MRIGHFAVLGAMLATAAGAQEAAVPVPAQIVSLAADTSSRMTVPVLLDGRGPYRFIVDTGAERTVISDRLAAALALRSAGTARLHAVTGMMPVDLVHVATLDIDRHRATGLRAPAMSEINLGGAGLIGVDTLGDQRVTIDFRRRSMAIAPARSRDPDARPDDIVVRARSRAGRLVIMDARLDGEKVAVILDTGSQASLGNEALRRKLFGQRKQRNAVPVELRDVNGGVMSAIYTTTRSLRISDFRVNALPIALADAHIFTELGFADRPAMLLGMDALALFDRVTIDFGKRTARFLRPEEDRDGV